MSTKKNRRQWEDLGRLDPFWAMTGTNKFGAWNIEEFLQTGDNQVQDLLRDLSRFSYPERHETVLDFGCGVGRLARAFQNHFEHYVGLDISAPLIAKARELHADQPRASFIISAGATLPFASDRFDLVHSWAVFQHIADRRVALTLLAEMVRTLRPNGLMVFSAMDTIPRLYRLQPRRRIYALLQGGGVPERVLYHQFKLYPQEVHFIPQAQVLAQLQAVGARVLDVRSDAPTSAPHPVRVYYVTK